MDRKRTNIKRFESDMVYQQYVSDLGMSLELYISKDGNEMQNGVPYPLLKVVADEETEIQYMEIEIGKDFVQIPVSEVKTMLEKAGSEVRSEKWFEKNVFKEFKDT